MEAEFQRIVDTIEFVLGGIASSDDDEKLGELLAKGLDASRRLANLDTKLNSPSD